MIAFGMNHHAIRWHRELSAFGHAVSLIHLAEGDDPPQLPIPAVTVRLPNLRLPTISAARAWRDAIASTQPDVVYMQWVFARPAMIAALGAHWPLVLTVMGSDVRQSHHFAESATEQLWRTALLQRADAITVAAKPLAEVVARYVPHLTSRIHIVPFGVDTATFAPRPVAEKPNVLRFGHFKGDDAMYGRLDLLRATEPWIAQGRPVQLVFAGRQSGRDSPVRAWLAERPYMQAGIVDHGVLHVDEMARLYQTVDVYVLNSEQESFGLAAAEALACGVPVVASRVGGIPTLVRSGDTGILVDCGDIAGLRAALDELADHPLLRRSMGERGRKLVQERFEMRDVARAMCDVIERAPGLHTDHGGSASQLLRATRTWAGLVAAQAPV